MNHTWSKFKNEVHAMNDKERKHFLVELQTDLMYERTRKHTQHNTNKIKTLKKQIKYIKNMR